MGNNRTGPDGSLHPALLCSSWTGCVENAIPHRRGLSAFLKPTRCLLCLFGDLASFQIAMCWGQSWAQLHLVMKPGSLELPATLFNKESFRVRL